MLADQILRFLFHLHLPFALPEGVSALDVHKDADVQEACTSFYKKYYHQEHKRKLLLGINPGRFGGGVTGIPFTDPIRLEAACAINNHFPKKQELSSVFMYEMIQAYGGPLAFYRDHYISSVSPLGFVQNGKNLNYYDNKPLLKTITPFVVDCLKEQLSWGLDTDTCFCIGEGENHKYLEALNKEYQFFKKIVTLPHPRFVMQYKLKSKQAYIDLYIKKILPSI